jgi:hypothetical protein
LLPAKAQNTARKRARDLGFPQIDDLTEIADDMAEGWHGLLEVLEAEGGDAEPITDGQMKKLNTVLNLKGHVGPLRHDFAAGVLGRPIASLHDLSASDANRLIDLLEAAGA